MDKLAWLIPDFMAFSSLPFDSKLSTGFVCVLITITVIFLLKSFYSAFKAWKRISWLKNHISTIPADEISSKREHLYTLAKEKNDSVGHLWLEFDETLIEIRKDNKSTLFNTFDAIYFFNTTTLAKGITENRLIAAVPGFLTAIGVIGTFVGLQIGLSEMNISESVSVDEMKSGVAAVIGGAKVAFMTSVWGVFLSVLFNFTEKFMEQWIRMKIDDLQKTIDALFPRLSAEVQLQTIADSSVEARDSLQGLAEQIGVKMQESMLTATSGISEALETSLNKIMAPAINKLVDDTSEGNQKALEEILTKFMDGFGAQGQQQKLAMEEASMQVNDSIAGMNGTMESFVNKMETSQEKSAEREQQLVSSLSLQVSKLVEQSDQQARKMNELMETQLSSLNSSFENGQKQAVQRDSALAQQAETISSTTLSLIEQVEMSIKSHQSSSKQILQQGQSLQLSVESMVLASEKTTDSMRDSANELKSATDSMSLFSSHIQEASKQLSEAVTDAVEATKNLAIENQSSAKSMTLLRDEILSETTRFAGVADVMSGMVDTAGSTFSELKISQSEYLQSLKGNVAALTEQMTTLLSDYSTQANAQTTSHLKIWAESSTQYAESMNSAVRTLSSVVDEIQDKLGE